MALKRESEGWSGDDALAMLLAEGELALERGDAETAAGKYREALHAAPRRREGWVRLASVLYLELDRTGEALEIAEAALETFPDDAELHRLAGEMQLDRADDDGEALEEAVDHLGRATEERPGDARAGFFHAEALLRTGDREAALREHERVLDEVPDHVDGWVRLAVLRDEDDDREGARRAAEEARRRDPDHPALPRLAERGLVDGGTSR